MGKSRQPALVPVHPTRRNTSSDRKPGAGSVATIGRHPTLSKKGGAGCANWGRETDVFDDYDGEYDLTEPSAEESLATSAGLEWAEVEDLSDEDESNMAAIEVAMSEVWLCDQEAEARQIQDEGEDFFNSLDPKSWVDF